MEHINKLASWDSSGAALKLILGLFLFVGLFSFFIHGIRIFQVSRSVNSGGVVPKELSTLTRESARGFIEVTGYVGKPFASTFIDPFSSLTPRTTNFYPLYVEPVNARGAEAQPRLFVRENENQILEENAQVKVKGIVGIETYPRDLKMYRAIPLLIPSEQGVQISKVLMWFIPVSIGFFTGLFLILQWIGLLKSQFFGK